MHEKTYFRHSSYVTAALFASMFGATGGCAANSAAADVDVLSQQAGGHDDDAHGDESGHSDESAAHDHPVPTLTRVSTVEGLAAPESVYYDAESKTWFVSNIGVSGTTGDGFISRLDAKGALVQREFIVGLDDPKGLRVHKGILYVADSKVVVRVDLKKPGEPKRIPVPDAVFLNDLTVDPANGDVYVSDTFLNAIYRLRGDAASVVLRSPALAGPNGLIVQKGALLVATLGPDLNATTLTTSAPGRVLSVDLISLEVKSVTEPIGFLDGIETLDEGFLVTNYRVGTVYVDGHGALTKVQDNLTDGLKAAADLGYSKAQSLVGVPDGQGTKVVFYKLSWPHDH